MTRPLTDLLHKELTEELVSYLRVVKRNWTPKEHPRGQPENAGQFAPADAEAALPEFLAEAHERADEARIARHQALQLTHSSEADLTGPAPLRDTHAEPPKGAREAHRRAMWAMRNANHAWHAVMGLMERTGRNMTPEYRHASEQAQRTHNRFWEHYELSGGGKLKRTNLPRPVEGQSAPHWTENQRRYVATPAPAARREVPLDRTTEEHAAEARQVKPGTEGMVRERPFGAPPARRARVTTNRLPSQGWQGRRGKKPPKKAYGLRDARDELLSFISVVKGEHWDVSDEARDERGRWSETAHSGQGEGGDGAHRDETWDGFAKRMRADHGVDLELSERPTHVSVSLIRVPKDKRGEGVASRVMTELLKKADAAQMPVTLTPSNDFGASKTKLTQWYRRLGFSPNKGKLPESTDSMVRFPTPETRGNIHVPASAASEVAEARAHGDLTPRINGQTIRGEPISPKDGRIPDTVYHVSPAAAAIVKDGTIRAGGKGGLGGTDRDQIVSMTTNPEVAENLKSSMQTLADVARSVPPDPGYKQEGRSEWGEQVLDRLRDHAKREGWEYKAGTPEQLSVMQKNYSLGDWSTHYFNERASANPGSKRFQNPIFFGVKQEDWAKLDPKEIGIVPVPKASLDNGALLTDFDLSEKHGLTEIRSYGDIKLPKGTAYKVAKSGYKDTEPRIPGGRTGGGRWTSGSTGASKPVTGTITPPKDDMADGYYGWSANRKTLVRAHDMQQQKLDTAISPGEVQSKASAALNKKEVAEKLTNRLAPTHGQDLINYFMDKHSLSEKLDHDTKWTVADPLGDDRPAIYPASFPYNSELERMAREGNRLTTFAGDDPRLHRQIQREAVSSLVDNWATTSNDHDPVSLAMQESAVKEFGLKGTASWSDVPRDTQTVLDKYGSLFQGFLRAQYDETQAFFRKHGVKSVNLYRGMGVDPRKAQEYEESNRVTLRPISSFSYSFKVADAFAQTATAQSEWEDEDIVRMVLQAHVPASRVLSTAATGVGCLHEREMTVLGGAATVRMTRVSTVTSATGASDT